MATEAKKYKRAPKRCKRVTEVEQDKNQTVPTLTSWSDDYQFLSPNEIYTNSLGIVYCLTTKRLLPLSFIELYQRSLKHTWSNVLQRERRALKPNINSVEKCFMINRLITECDKDPYQFARQTGELYEEIKSRVSNRVMLTLAIEDFYDQVQIRTSLQAQRRLFYVTPEEVTQSQSLITLQYSATTFFSLLLSSYQKHVVDPNYHNLQKLLNHSFMIMIQPSVSEFIAVTKYDKLGNIYSAKLNTRLICLLNVDIIENHLTFSDVEVTLFPCDRQLDPLGEKQNSVKWQKRQIVDDESIVRSFYYIEIESIQLTKLDPTNSRPLYNSRICQLEFQVQIAINELNLTITLTLTTQRFGICSHSQYYPEYTAQIILHEVEQLSQLNHSITLPHVLLYYVKRYFTRITGVETKNHTIHYIENLLNTAYEAKGQSQLISSYSVYIEILSKLISQIQMFIDYPFLSMMYHDGLFLGICNDSLDQELHGTRQQPTFLFRFNSLAEQQSTQHSTLRFVVHNDRLTRATFHAKSFIDEMCQVICKSASNPTISMRCLIPMTDQTFHHFSLYFNNELLRVNCNVTQMNDTYQPIIPVLWDTMRFSIDEQPNEQSAVDPFGVLTNVCNEAISLTPDQITVTSKFLSILTSDNKEKQKQLLFHIFNDDSQPKSYTETATQTSPIPSSNVSDIVFDNS